MDIVERYGAFRRIAGSDRYLQIVLRQKPQEEADGDVPDFMAAMLPRSEGPADVKLVGQARIMARRYVAVH